MKSVFRLFTSRLLKRKVKQIMLKTLQTHPCHIKKNSWHLMGLKTHIWIQLGFLDYISISHKYLE